jgi:DNA-binding transcriptional MerR regulator
MSPFSDLDGPPIADSSSTLPATEDSSSADRAGSDGTGPIVLGRLSAARILLFDKLAGMPRREVKQIIRQQGGVVVEPRAVERNVQDPTKVAHGVEEERAEEGKDGRTGSEREAEVTMVVVGDNVSQWRVLLQQQYPTIALGVDSGRIELLQESEFWLRAGLMDPQDDVRRLYTPAMLAELLAVPVPAIRRWYRQGTLVACRHVRRLPYFDFAEVAVARHLADLHKAGCSLRVIDRKLQELATMMPDSRRPLAEVGVVVEGRRLFIRRGDDLEEPSGQRQFDFDRLADVEGQTTGDWKESIPMAAGGPLAEAASPVIESGSPVFDSGLPASEDSLTTLDRLQQEAIGYEDQGALDLAVETYRTILMAGGPSVEINFALADVLYRQGDYAAARERYYMAIEMDEEYVEARANLGCVLAEMNELEMAVAAFQGALAYHVDYADVHYHMAGALDRMQRFQEAQIHWQAFLALAPESSWAEIARMRLAAELVEAVDEQPVNPEESRRNS